MKKQTKPKKLKLFAELKRALQDAIAYERGNAFGLRVSKRK